MFAQSHLSCLHTLRSSGLSGIAMALLVATLAGCDASKDTSSSASDPNAQPTAPTVDPLAVAGHVAGARAAAMRGDSQAVQAHVEEVQREMLEASRIPDARRPIDRESARSAVREVAGVQSVVWLDRGNLLVMVDGAAYRNHAMINAVCERMAPLGDTLAVVVNLQDVTATTAAGAQTLARNCRLPSGEQAFMARPRQVDVVPEPLRQEFERQQQAH